MTSQGHLPKGHWFSSPTSGTEGKRGWEGSAKPFIVGVVLVIFFRCRGDIANVDYEGQSTDGCQPFLLPISALSCFWIGDWD
jgi:hypothetical protein